MSQDDDDGPRTEHLSPIRGSSLDTPDVYDEQSSATQDIRARIVLLRARVEDTYFELGRLLFRVKFGHYYLRWDNPATGKRFQGWDEYVEHEVKFSHRKCNHLVTIWWWFSELNCFHDIRDSLREIGWTKTSLLVGVLDDRNYSEWLSRAQAKSHSELERDTQVALHTSGRGKRPSAPTPKALRPPGIDAPPIETTGTEVTPTDLSSSAAHPIDLAAMGDRAGIPPTIDTGVGSLGVPAIDPHVGVSPPSEDDERVHLYPWMAKLSRDQRAHVQRACEAVWVSAGKTEVIDQVNATALDYMSTFFLSSFAGTVSPDPKFRSLVMLQDVLRSVERNFGVDLIAVLRGENECVFGEKTIERLDHGTPDVQSSPTAEGEDDAGQP